MKDPRAAERRRGPRGRGCRRCAGRGYVLTGRKVLALDGNQGDEVRPCTCVIVPAYLRALDLVDALDGVRDLELLGRAWRLRDELHRLAHAAPVPDCSACRLNDVLEP